MTIPFSADKLFLVIAVVALFGMPVSATSEPEVSFFGFYVDNSLCQPDCAVAIVVYQESNGIDGLQRRDSIVDDTFECEPSCEPDTLLLELYE